MNYGARSTTHQTRFSCSILINLEFSRQIVENHSNVKFHENPSSCSQVFPRGQTGMTKPTAVFRYFAKVQEIPSYETGRFITMLKIHLLVYYRHCGSKFFIQRPPTNPPPPNPYLSVMRRSVPWVTWKLVRGVEGSPCRGLLRCTLANIALAYPSQGGRCAEMHWGSNNSVVKDLLEEPGHTQLHVGLLSAWGTVDGDRMFSLLSWESYLNGDSGR